MCRVAHKIICDYLSHKLSRGTRGGRPWDTFESTDGSPFCFFFFPFWGTDRSKQTAHKGELKHFGFIPKQYFSSLMEHKHQKAIMHFSCLFLSNGRAGGSSVPDGKHLPLIGLQLSKAKYIRFIHSSTFS